MNPEDNRGGAVRLHQPADCRQQSGGGGVLLPQSREKGAERLPRLSPLLTETRHSLWGCEESHGLACLCGSSVGTNSRSGAGGWLSCGDALHPRAGQFQQVISVLWASIPLPGAPWLPHPGVFSSGNSIHAGTQPCTLRAVPSCSHRHRPSLNPREASQTPHHDLWRK